MKKINCTLILFFFFNFLFAQNPLLKKWDKRFGGSDTEWIYAFQQTTDAGFILAGVSFSDSSGDKTQNNWGPVGFPDYWVIKTDSLGMKQWDKRYGGTLEEYLNAAQQTNDGGYIFGGYSTSGISGDKTQPNWDTVPNITPDYWIIKTDALGNIQWDKDFGGTNDDRLYTLQQTIDGGYILGGSSASGISGNKTQPGWGGWDYWIVKTDSFGNIQWDKDFGGTDDDELISLQQTTDGGYILGGYSGSPISGDKSQDTWGYYDYWIVKIDSLGNKQWDKDFGGATNDEYFYSIKQAGDGGYIAGGVSFSDSSGNKTSPSWSPGLADYWMVKTDSLGNKQWDRDFGGTSDDDDLIGSIFVTSDGGYLMAGCSASPLSGDKTENNLGPDQTWIVKTDSIGNKMWDKTIFTTGGDRNGLAIETNDGCYAIVNSTGAGIGGYKTETARGLEDYWIVKFCDTALTSAINIQNYSSQFFAYPNPFTSDISIIIQKHNLQHAGFSIKNILGQTVFYKREVNLNDVYTKTIDLSFLSKGIYLLDVIVDGERTVMKIVKE